MVLAIALGAGQGHVVEMHRFLEALFQQLPDDGRKRDRQCEGWHEHVADDVGPKIEAQPQHTLEQIEIAAEGQLQ